MAGAAGALASATAKETEREKERKAWSSITVGGDPASLVVVDAVDFEAGKSACREAMAQYGACCDEGMLCRVRVVQAVIEGDELAGEVPALLADKNYDEALRSLEAAKTCYETAVAEDDYHARLMDSSVEEGGRRRRRR